MAGKGGARPGAGRKKKADEDLVRNMAEDSIISKYGTLKAGFVALLESKEASLIKFVYEHAFGKPKEKHELSTDNGAPIINFIFPDGE